MSELVLSQDKKAAFEVRTVTTRRELTVSLEGFDGYRVRARRINDGRVFVRIGCKTASVQHWRVFGHGLIDEHLGVPETKPISFAAALAKVPEYEVPRKGLWSISFFSVAEEVTAATDGAVKIEQAERVRRARARSEREAKDYGVAVSRNKSAHELLEPMLADIEEALR